jgi:hypothetical protein
VITWSKGANPRNSARPRQPPSGPPLPQAQSRHFPQGTTLCQPIANTRESPLSAPPPAQDTRPIGKRQHLLACPPVIDGPAPFDPKRQRSVIRPDTKAEQPSTHIAESARVCIGQSGNDSARRLARSLIHDWLVWQIEVNLRAGLRVMVVAGWWACGCGSVLERCVVAMRMAMRSDAVAAAIALVRRGAARGVAVVTCAVLLASAGTARAANGRAPSGSSWHKAIGLKGPAGFIDPYIESVSCASPGNCAAGGTYGDRINHIQAFVVAERAGRWGRAVEVPGTAALNTGGFAGHLGVLPVAGYLHRIRHLGHPPHRPGQVVRGQRGRRALAPRGRVAGRGRLPLDERAVLRVGGQLRGRRQHPPQRRPSASCRRRQPGPWPVGPAAAAVRRRAQGQRHRRSRRRLLLVRGQLHRQRHRALVNLRRNVRRQRASRPVGPGGPDPPVPRAHGHPRGGQHHLRDVVRLARQLRHHRDVCIQYRVHMDLSWSAKPAASGARSRMRSA